MENQNSEQVAQQTPVTPEVTEGEQSGDNTPKINMEYALKLLFSIIELLLVAFAYCNIVLNPNFTLLGVFIYLSNFFVGSLKEVFNFKMDDMHSVNLAATIIAGVQLILVIATATGHLSTIACEAIYIVLRGTIAVVPIKTVWYIGYYCKKTLG